MKRSLRPVRVREQQVERPSLQGTSGGRASTPTLARDSSGKPVATRSWKSPAGARRRGKSLASMSGRVLDRELQILGGPECHLLARFDLDGLSGRRISAHAGCARANLQDAEARNPDPLTFLEVLGDQAHKIAEDRLPRAFRELMILGQPCRQMLERNGASFGSRWCFRFAWARNRHDGLPSSEARKCAGRKRYDSRPYGKRVSADAP